MNEQRLSLLKETIEDYIVDLENGTVVMKCGKEPYLSSENRLHFSPYLRDLKRTSILYVHEIIAFKSGLDLLNKEVNHIDGDKTNNKPSNLECVTREENLRHQAEMGLYQLPEPRQGSKHHNTKLTEDDVLKIRELYNSGMKQKEISKIFNVGITAISKIVKRVNWKHI